MRESSRHRALRSQFRYSASPARDRGTEKVSAPAAAACPSKKAQSLARRLFKISRSTRRLNAKYFSEMVRTRFCIKSVCSGCRAAQGQSSFWQGMNMARQAVRARMVTGLLTAQPARTSPNTLPGTRSVMATEPPSGVVFTAVAAPSSKTPTSRVSKPASSRTSPFSKRCRLGAKQSIRRARPGGESPANSEVAASSG